MIQVQNLTKKFDGKPALDNVSFEVAKGDILGFLGPNGAGKTTTMRILTAFIPPTAGTALIGGFDVTQQPLQVKKLIGYLPEQVPLYPEMRVSEYLKFRAELKGVRHRELGKAVDRVVDECQLKEVEKKVIAHLSKGFRQRTGVADALISEPPILILDEPTIGLDPSQIRQTRELIRNLGEQRTLILSTHILPEAEQVCNRVLIISRGRIVGEGTPSELQKRLSGQSIVKADIRGADVTEEKIRRIEGIKEASLQRSEGSVGVTLTTDRAQADIEEKLFRMCVDNGWVLRSLHRETPSMEDVFIELTGRDQEPGPAPEAAVAETNAGDGEKKAAENSEGGQA